MKTCFECGGANPFTGARTKSLITLEQSGGKGKRFTVTYGLQRWADLTYTDACAAVGECILHHLCCEGLADNEGD